MQNSSISSAMKTSVAPIAVVPIFHREERIAGTRKPETARTIRSKKNQFFFCVTKNTPEKISIAAPILTQLSSSFPSPIAKTVAKTGWR